MAGKQSLTPRTRSHRRSFGLTSKCIFQWLYIIFGLITLVWAVVLVVFLPNTPAKARFLSKEESAVVVDRVRRNQTGIKDDHFKWSHFREVLTDLNIWLVVLFQLTFSIPNGGLTAVSSR